jgi:hypothetical protein
MTDLGKTLILFGALLVAAGVLVLAAGKIPWLGRLPGDFTYRRDGLVVYFPLGTCLLLSVVASVLLSLFLRR